MRKKKSHSDLTGFSGEERYIAARALFLKALLKRSPMSDVHLSSELSLGPYFIRNTMGKNNMNSKPLMALKDLHSEMIIAYSTGPKKNALKFYLMDRDAAKVEVGAWSQKYLGQKPIEISKEPVKTSDLDAKIDTALKAFLEAVQAKAQSEISSKAADLQARIADLESALEKAQVEQPPLLNLNPKTMSEYVKKDVHEQLSELKLDKNLSEKLKDLAHHFETLGRLEKEALVYYSDEDCIHAFTIFDTITRNRAIRKAITDKLDEEFAKQILQHMRDELSKSFKGRTGLNPTRCM